MRRVCCGISRFDFWIYRCRGFFEFSCGNVEITVLATKAGPEINLKDLDRKPPELGTWKISVLATKAGPEVILKDLDRKPPELGT